MPPFAFLALLRADHRAIKTALEFLQWAKEQALPYLENNGVVWICDPVPLNIVKVAGVERAQLLIESTSRPKLHQFLTQWLQVLWVAKGSVRWYLEIDPQEF
jgi:primosomal protein N' (replication factor Y)